LEKQQAMGWKIAADYNNGIVTLGVNDRSGEPLELSELTAKIGRPVTEVDDRYLSLAKLDDGNFQAETTLAKGVWQIDMIARDNQGNTLEKSIRITVSRP
jgi:nitrogen fixation protein FixH